MKDDHFTFRFFSSIASQRRRLLSSSEFDELPLHSSLETILKNLEFPQSETIAIVSKKTVWKESLSAVKVLLIKSTLWQSSAMLGMVVSLLVTRQVLASHYGLGLTILLCLGFLLAEIFKNGVHYFDAQRRAQLARGIQLHLFGLINKKLLNLDPVHKGEFTSGNVKTLVAGDVEAIEDFITAASQAWVPAVLAMVLTGPPIVYLTGWLGVVGIGLTLLQLPLAYASARYVERFNERKQSEQDRLTTVIGEWVRNIRLVRYLHREAAIAREISIILRRFSLESAKAHTVVIFSFAITYSWWAVPILGMIVTGSVLRLPLDATTFFPALWLLSLLSNQIQFLPHSIIHYGAAAAGVNRLVRFLSLPEIHRHEKNKDEEVDSTGEPIRLHFRDVRVVLGEHPALEVPTLSLSLYERTAVVGEVGAGKSTLLNLIVGEIAPTSGEIEVEFSSGIRASFWCRGCRNAVRAAISYAPQEPFLSNATLRANLDLLATQSEDRVRMAVEKAALTADLAQFEHGVSQEVGEIGINLSGGQRQRVSLARAFLSERRYMVLDDPLSAVDAATESSLIESFFSTGGGLVLATHRLDHLLRFDRVLVLSNGRIVEDSSPKVLAQDPHSVLNSFIHARRELESG